MSGPISRRDFLKVAAVAGGGILISLYLPGCDRLPGAGSGPEPTPLSGPDEMKPNAWVRLANDGTITITIHRSELGQGVRTSLAMILAEDLGADWSKVRVEQAVADIRYGDQNTGGSTSIQSSYATLRHAGALARQMLIAAAAQVWGCSEEDCSAENSLVTNKKTHGKLSFGHLVPLAATLPVPSVADIELKPASEFKIIGTRLGRIDDPEILTGKAIYGMDIRLPGLRYAVVARSPVLGGNLVSFDDSAARAVPGVVDVVQIRTGVAVVADSTWNAIKGRNALISTWDKGLHPDLNSADIEARLLGRVTSPAQDGELAAYYTLPYFAHAPLESMNCTADVRRDRCEIWVPTQNVQAVKQRATVVARLPGSAVTVHVTLVGGGFGRRLESTNRGGTPAVDYVEEAIQVSQAIGAPVQLVWTREDDIRYDIFHPMSVTRVSARLDSIDSLQTNLLEAGEVPTGYWRAVTNVPEAFARESFVDEFAFATHQDPLELRRKMLTGRARAVLDLAAEKAGWGKPLPSGQGRGIAYHASWGVTPCAQVAEVSVDDQGNVTVDRVVCAVDCGTPINPGMIEAQMEGGIVFGISAALKKAITVKNGQIQQSNFFDYPILRADESPRIEVYIVPSTEIPTGVGEMSNPVTMPAVTNAIFAATGKRIRQLPVQTEDLTG